MGIDVKLTDAEVRTVLQDAFKEFGETDGVRFVSETNRLGNPYTDIAKFQISKAKAKRAIPYQILSPSEAPKKTQDAYKLMKIFDDSSDMLFALYADVETGETPRGFKLGEWHKAEVAKIKMAHRPGIHTVDLPLFLQGKAGELKDNVKRVWVKVQLPEINQKTQSEADATPMLNNGQREGIRDRLIGVDEAYEFKTNSNASGANSWPIAGSMKIVRILSDREVAQILKDNDRAEFIENSQTGISDDMAESLNERYSAQFQRRGNLTEQSESANRYAVTKDKGTANIPAQDNPVAEGGRIKTIDGVNIVEVSDVTKIGRGFSVASMLKPLDVRDLYVAEEVNINDAISVGRDFYSGLMKNPVSCPAFNGENATFGESGWDHIIGKRDGNYKMSEDGIKRRLKLLPKAKATLENTPFVDEIRQKDEYTKEYGILGRFIDGTVLRVVVEEREMNGKTFLSVYDWSDVSKKIRKAPLPELPESMSTGYGVGKAPSGQQVDLVNTITNTDEKVKSESPNQSRSPEGGEQDVNFQRRGR